MKGKRFTKTYEKIKLINFCSCFIYNSNINNFCTIEQIGNGKKS